MSFFKTKPFLAALAVSVSLILGPDAPPAKANAGDNALNTLVVMGIITTSFLATTGESARDVQRAQSLIDQAYAGNGEKLEILANASGRSVEDVAGTIIGLEKEGLISPENPKAMADVLAAALSQ